MSWIWDGNFEKLMTLSKTPTLISGLRVVDLKKRLEVAGNDEANLLVEEDLGKLIDKIRALPEEKVYILATYTAMLDFRKALKEQGYL